MDSKMRRWGAIGVAGLVVYESVMHPLEASAHLEVEQPGGLTKGLSATLSSSLGSVAIAPTQRLWT